MIRSIRAILLLSAVAIARATPPPAAPDVVQMSPYEVSARSVDFKRWIKVGSPNFIVYTDASAKQAAQVLRELEMLHVATQRFFGRKALQLGPRRLVLPTMGSDWQKLKSKGSVEWDVAVATVGEMISDLIVVQYDWQHSGIWIVRAAQGYSEMERVNLRSPFWFTRGIGKFFETAEFSKDRVRLGRQNPRTAHLSTGTWLPWSRFFEIDVKSPEFVRDETISMFDAQAAHVVQYLFTHEQDQWRQRLNLWLMHLNADQPVTEDAFVSAFTIDWEKWHHELSIYMEGGRHRIYEVPVPPETSRFDVKTYSLPVREMRDLFVLTQILTQEIAASETALDAVLAEGLATESLRETLAAACLQRKRPAAALTELRSLIDAGSVNPRVYAAAAAVLFFDQEWEKAKIDLDRRLGSEVAEIRRWCRKALELEPRFLEPAMTLAWAEALAPEVDQQGIATIEALYSRLKGIVPTDELIMALACALWRSGDTPTARALAERVEREKFGTELSRRLAAEMVMRLPAFEKPPASAKESSAP